MAVVVVGVVAVMMGVAAVVVGAVDEGRGGT